MKKDWSLKRSFVALAVIGVFAYIAYAVDYSNKHPVNPELQPATQVVREDITPERIYSLVNEERGKAGAEPLTANPEVQQAASEKCNDMVANNYYEHVNPKTGQHGYDFAVKRIPSGTLFNENLTQGQAPTNADVVKAWMDSPPHKATLLEPRFTDTGIAVCKLPSEPEGSHTVVQQFVEIKPSGPYIAPDPDYSAACCDGTHSFSTGRGTCSHHDGVCEWL